MANYLYIGIDLQEGFLTDELKHTDFVQRVKSCLTKQDLRPEADIDNQELGKNVPCN